MTAPAGRTIETGCCIAGGGPAGVMLGLLLARAGVEVVVLEKHADFLRDFRGDTIHPSTLELMDELGLLCEFLSRPHQEVRHLSAVFPDGKVDFADFTHLKVKCPYTVLMPQWHFLDFLSDHASAYPSFDLRMESEVTDLVEEDGRIAGARAQTADGPLVVRADLVVGADGRYSVVRARAGLPVERLGSPIDVLWMRLSRQQSDGDEPMGHVGAGGLFVMIYRGDYWQCAFVIRKGGFDEIRRQGLGHLRELIAAVAPHMRDRLGEIGDWDDVRLLSVEVDRLVEWARPGLLCIGDAAHAMSPVGGVGINLAIQDAVAAANALAGPLSRGAPSLEDLNSVRRRRMYPTRVTQRFQVLIQNRLIARTLESSGMSAPPWPLWLIGRIPLLQRVPAWIVGIGVRAEHIETPDRHAG